MFLLFNALALSIILLAISCIALAYISNSKIVLWITVFLLAVSVGLALYLNSYVIAYILFLLFALAKYISSLNFPRWR